MQKEGQGRESCKGSHCLALQSKQGIANCRLYWACPDGSLALPGAAQRRLEADLGQLLAHHGGPPYVNDTSFWQVPVGSDFSALEALLSLHGEPQLRLVQELQDWEEGEVYVEVAEDYLHHPERALRVRHQELGELVLVPFNAPGAPMLEWMGWLLPSSALQRGVPLLQHNTYDFHVTTCVIACIVKPDELDQAEMSVKKWAASCNIPYSRELQERLQAVVKTMRDFASVPDACKVYGGLPMVANFAGKTFKARYEWYLRDGGGSEERPTLRMFVPGRIPLEIVIMQTRGNNTGSTVMCLVNPVWRALQQLLLTKGRHLLVVPGAGAVGNMNLLRTVVDALATKRADGSVALLPGKCIIKVAGSVDGANAAAGGWVGTVPCSNARRVIGFTTFPDTCERSSRLRHTDTRDPDLDCLFKVPPTTLEHALTGVTNGCPLQSVKDIFALMDYKDKAFPATVKTVVQQVLSRCLTVDQVHVGGRTMDVQAATQLERSRQQARAQAEERSHLQRLADIRAANSKRHLQGFNALSPREKSLVYSPPPTEPLRKTMQRHGLEWPGLPFEGLAQSSTGSILSPRQPMYSRPPAVPGLHHHAPSSLGGTTASGCSGVGLAKGLAVPSSAQVVLAAGNEDAMLGQLAEPFSHSALQNVQPATTVATQSALVTSPGSSILREAPVAASPKRSSAPPQSATPPKRLCATPEKRLEIVPPVQANMGLGSLLGVWAPVPSKPAPSPNTTAAAVRDLVNLLTGPAQEPEEPL